MINYFVNEYDKKYPQLKGNKDNRSYMTIDAMEKGERIRVGYVDCFSKNRVECIFSIYNMKDKPKYEKWIKNNWAVQAKSREGYPVIFCYPPPKINVDNQMDPYGEEEWDDDSEQGIIDWLSTLSKKEIEEEIQKEINKI